MNSLPLCWRRVVIGRVDLAGVTVRLTRDRRGRRGAAEIVRRLREAESGGESRPARRGPGVRLAVNRLSLRDVELAVRDGRRGRAAPTTIDIAGLDLWKANASGRFFRVAARGGWRRNGGSYPVAVAGRLALDGRRSAVTADRFRVTAPGIEFQLDGEVKDLHARAVLAVRLEVGVDLARAWTEVALRDAGVEWDGDVLATASVTGLLDGPRVTGEIRLRDVQCAEPGREALLTNLRGSVHVDGNRWTTTDLRMILGESPLTFMCALENLGLPGARGDRPIMPRGRFVLESPLVRLSDLLGGLTAGGAAWLAEHLPERADVEGEVRAGTVRRGPFACTDVGATLSFDGSRVGCRIAARGYGGEGAADGSFTVGEEGAAWAVRARLAGVTFGTLLRDARSAFGGTPGTGARIVEGVAGCELALSGRGPSRKTGARWSGEGTVTVTDGRLELAGPQARQLRKAGLEGETRFERFSATMRLEDDELAVSDSRLELVGETVYEYTGKVGFDRHLQGVMTAKRPDRPPSGGVGDGAAAARGWDVTGDLGRPVLRPREGG